MSTDKRILDVVREHGPLSRAEAARRLTLSKPTVSAVVNALVERGLLQEVGRGRLPSGRSPRLLGFNARCAVIAGVDLGASNTRISLADLDGQAIAQDLDRTPQGDDLAEVIAERITSVARENAPGIRLVAATIGTPGVVDGERLRYAPNLPALEAPGFLTRLRAALPCPLEVHNDVKLGAIGEAHDRPGEVVAYLAIGTGLGAAVAHSSEAWTGASGRAGEIGYLPFQSPVGACLEDVLSGVGLANLYRHLGGKGGAAEALEGTDPASREARATFMEALAAALAVLTLAYDPHRIVLGGGVGLHLEDDLDVITAQLARRLPFVPPLEISRHGDLASLRGAVMLACQRANQELVA